MKYSIFIIVTGLIVVSALVGCNSPFTQQAATFSSSSSRNGISGGGGTAGTSNNEISPAIVGAGWDLIAPTGSGSDSYFSLYGTNLVQGAAPPSVVLTCGSATYTAQVSYSVTGQVNAFIPTPPNNLSCVAKIVVNGQTSSSSPVFTLDGTSGSFANTSVPGSNLMSITVNGSQCGNADFQYLNEPCVSVTVCQPGTSNCQTINNILVDTGSFGLRIFANNDSGLSFNNDGSPNYSSYQINTSPLLTVPLTPVTVGGLPLAECAVFGSGTQWGQVEYADVILGSEPAVQVPIVVINQSYATAPSPCNCTLQQLAAGDCQAEMGPEGAGYNGILGVGLFAQDGGAVVTSLANYSSGTDWPYFSCSGSNCSPVAVPLAQQVQNPVALLPVDNNGVVLELPTISAAGTGSANGSLLMGIATQANNTPSGVNMYAAYGSSSDNAANFNTTFEGNQILGYIDSGSSVLFFPQPSGNSLPYCYAPTSTDPSVPYCPTSTQNLTAVNSGINGSHSASVSFQVANYNTLVDSGNAVFMNAASSDYGGFVSGTFAFGLPFFFGKSVYVGLEGAQSSLGTGPYWAY